MPQQQKWREALLEQLAYLSFEVEALRTTLSSIPAEVLEARPLDRWSIKETLGHLADTDRHVFLPRLQRMNADEAPVFENVDQDALVIAHGWNERGLPEILDALADSRRQLVAFLQSLPATAWDRAATFPDGKIRNVYGLAEYVVLHDLNHLKQLGQRLHESNLTDRPVDLPK